MRNCDLVSNSEEFRHQKQPGYGGAQHTRDLANKAVSARIHGWVIVIVLGGIIRQLRIVLVEVPQLILCKLDCKCKEHCISTEIHNAWLGPWNTKQLPITVHKSVPTDQYFFEWDGEEGSWKLGEDYWSSQMFSMLYWRVISGALSNLMKIKTQKVRVTRILVLFQWLEWLLMTTD